MSNDWVQPGADVVFRGWGHRFGRVAKIEKVYKNGNFTIEGNAQQYRPNREYANETGGRGYHRDSLYPLTDEIKREVAREQSIRAAQKIVRDEGERLDKLARTESDELLAEAEAISARAKP